jgi:hypothetical protein
MPEGIRSRVRLFVDDTMGYLTITSDTDADYLQEDLDKLAEWEGKWKITFHPDKCNVLTLAVVYVQVSLQESYSCVGLVADVPFM